MYICTVYVVHASCSRLVLVETAGIFLVISAVLVMEVSHLQKYKIKISISIVL